MNWLTLQQQYDIRHIAVQTPAQESCGFVLTDGRVVTTTNAAEHPELDFLITAEDYAYWDATGIKGCWHTHLERDGFSPQDQSVLSCDTLPWAVYTLASDKFWQCAPGQTAPLLGRPFVFGVYDCYALVSDKLTELGVHLPSWERGGWGSWDEPGFMPFDNEWPKHGQQVSADFREGDMILMNLGKHKNHTDHIGIFVDKQTFLHHPANKISQLQHWGSWWERHTRAIVRPNTLCLPK